VILSYLAVVLVIAVIALLRAPEEQIPKVVRGVRRLMRL
jgi:hypothetical protein